MVEAALAVSLNELAHPDTAETARLAAAFKHDSANIARWRAEEARTARWEARLRGEMPKRFSSDVRYPPEPLVEDLGRQVGILSDSGAHSTPEFLRELDLRVLTDGDPAQVQFSYFNPALSEIKGSLLYLASIHQQILLLFDWCVGGLFLSDTEWRRQLDKIRALGATLAAALPGIKEERGGPPQ